MFRSHGDNAAVVEPDAFEQELEHLSLHLGIRLVAPEDREVVEELLRLVEVRDRLRRKLNCPGSW